MRNWICGGLVVAALAACGCGGSQHASFNTTEEQRKTVRDNVTMLAQKFRQENGLGELDIYVRGDSTISESCPQGDGWASLDLINRTTNQVIKLKCSTVSEGIGCMTDEDFKTKRYAAEDGKCNPQVPFPIPHIGK